MGNEVFNNLNLREKIVAKIFAKTFKKVYNLTRVNIVNTILK